MRSIILVFLGAIMVTHIWAQDPAVENCPLSSVVQIDGQADEWPMEWMVDDEKRFSYNVCSDENNLYIRMKTTDELVLRKVVFFGLTLWLDPKGKKKERLGLRFPTGIEAKERIDQLSKTNDSRSNMSSSQRAEFQKEMTKLVLKEAEILELIGLADQPLTSTRSGITNGLKVAVATDESAVMLIYEAIIPFKSFRLSKSAIPVLGIGFETGKLKPPPAKAGGASAQSQGYSGSTTGTGMGRGLGNETRYTGNNPMTSSTSFWTTLKLK